MKNVDSAASPSIYEQGADLLKRCLQSLIAFLLQLPLVSRLDRCFGWFSVERQTRLLRLFRYEGELEIVEATRVKGWAWCKYKPHQPLIIDIYAGNHYLTTLQAADYREDLAEQGIGNGRHGFVWTPPVDLLKNGFSCIRARFAGCDVDLKQHAPKWMSSESHMGVNVPWVHSPFFPKYLAKLNNSSEIPEGFREHAQHFHEHGYVIVKQVASPELIEQIQTETQPLFNLDQPEGPRSYYRVQDAWRESEAVKKLAANDSVVALLKFLYGREPKPFQTLNFRFGTQQRAHSDIIHFNSIPAQYMCGVWVALEDIHSENGPLFYYPGSHHAPEVNYYDMVVPAEGPRSYEDFLEQWMAAQGYVPQSLEVSQGDALVWASNLVHGGRPIRNLDFTRWSQVTHYFFENCIYYSPRDSKMLSGEYALMSLCDVVTGKPLEHSYNGFSVQLDSVGNGRHHLKF